MDAKMETQNESRHAVRAEVTYTDWKGDSETFTRDFQIAKGPESVDRFTKIIEGIGFTVNQIVAYTNESGETTWL